MRILYIFRSIALWGGIERILVDKMNYLSDVYGMDVFFLTYDQGTHPQTFKLSENIHYEDLNICFYRRYKYNVLTRLVLYKKMILQYRRMLENRIKSINPDAIVTTTSDHLDIIIKAKGHIPLIVESHSICIRTINGGKCFPLNMYCRYRFLRCLAKVDVVVALTEGDAKEWRNIHPCVAVIPNFIHPHRSCVSNQNTKRAIFVGRFDYQKRAQDAISIWEKIRESHPDWVLDIYGDGDMLHEVSLLASSIGGVCVHKPLDNIFVAYKNSSLLLSTSLFEPFGLVLPEAMSCGLPVIAFDCPYGPHDIIQEGVDGFVIENRNINQFVEKVCLLMDNHDLRVKMGEEGIKSSSRYIDNIIMPQWIRLFQSLK